MAFLTGKYHIHPELLKNGGVRKTLLKRNLERTRPLIYAMNDIANRYQVTIAQVALNWVINFNGAVVVAIPGATKVYQAAESAGAMKFQLTKSELAELDELSSRIN